MAGGKHAGHRPAAIDGPDAEFSFWKDHFLLSAWIAAGFGLGAAIMIVLWPEGSGDPEIRDFVRLVWTAFIELAFWFGFLLGLLWGAARRIGSGLSGTLPWQPAHQLSARSVASRLSGQVACCCLFGALFLWLTQQFAPMTNGAIAQLLHSLQTVTQFGFAAAVMLAFLALVLQERVKQ